MGSSGCRAEPRRAGDGCQRPLVPRCAPQQLTPYPRGIGIGLGGYPRGQPPYRSRKAEGTRAWRKSGRRREGADRADPQDLHGMVKAALLEAQCPVGPHETHRQSA
jgi:hypothetical protein